MPATPERSGTANEGARVRGGGGEGARDGKSRNGKAKGTSKPARDVYGTGNGASGVTNVGSMVASDRPRGNTQRPGEEERDSGTSTYRT